METYNAKLRNLVTLHPDQTVGAMVNWTIPNQLAVPGAVLETAAQQHACNVQWLGAPTSPLARFKTWHYGARIPRARGMREILSTPARHTGADAALVTFVYSTNLDDAGRETGQLAALGSVTYCTATQRFWWRFDNGPCNAGEAAHEYLQRAVQAMPHVPDVDLQAFQQYVEASLSDVQLFAASQHYSGESLRLAAGFLFRKLGGFPLSDRGGVWYLPRTGTDRCPLAQATGFIQTVEQATSKQARFYQLAMPRTPDTMELAQQVVQDGLASRIAALRDKVDKVQQVTRNGQHAGKLEELAYLREDIATFRELLGIVDSELLSDAQALDDAMQAQLHEYQTGAPQARQPRAKAAPAASAPGVQASALDAAQQQAGAQALCDALAVQEQLGSNAAGGVGWQVVVAQAAQQLATLVPAGAVLVVEPDLAFGYFWTLDCGTGAHRVATGVATSLLDCCTAATLWLVSNP